MEVLVQSGPQSPLRVAASVSLARFLLCVSVCELEVQLAFLARWGLAMV